VPPKRHTQTSYQPKLNGANWNNRLNPTHDEGQPQTVHRQAGRRQITHHCFLFEPVRAASIASTKCSLMPAIVYDPVCPGRQGGLLHLAHSHQRDAAMEPQNWPHCCPLSHPDRQAAHLLHSHRRTTHDHHTSSAATDTPLHSVLQ